MGTRTQPFSIASFNLHVYFMGMLVYVAYACISMLVCVCVCWCEVHMSVYVIVYTHVYNFLWRPEDNLKFYSSKKSIIYWKSLSLAWDNQIDLWDPHISVSSACDCDCVLLYLAFLLNIGSEGGVGSDSCPWACKIRTLQTASSRAFFFSFVSFCSYSKMCQNWPRNFYRKNRWIVKVVHFTEANNI